MGGAAPILQPPTARTQTRAPRPNRTPRTGRARRSTHQPHKSIGLHRHWGAAAASVGLGVFWQWQQRFKPFFERTQLGGAGSEVSESGGGQQHCAARVGGWGMGSVCAR